MSTHVPARALRDARCAICGRRLPLPELMPVAMVRQSVVHLMRQEVPALPDDAGVCLEDLHRFRAAYVEDVLERERGDLDAIEDEVVKSLEEHETIAANLNEEFDAHLGWGQRIADRVAEIGGSWTFIIGFGLVLTVWIAINSVGLMHRPFDPYPYILLNLVLSCLAAIQAPVIMMSQNRQEAKDRLRSESDFKTNLKAELEIRHLSEKLDYLLMHQWQQLLEIQHLQMETMSDVAQRLEGGPPRG